MEDHENDKHKNEEHVSRERVDYPRHVQERSAKRRHHREEYAAEVAPGSPVVTKHENKGEEQVINNSGRISGYIGLAAGIASLFMWSIVLGPIAAVLGFFAYVNGSKTTGIWSIGLGALATLSYFAFIPFVR
ncbi:hypothetical protein ACT3XG_16430 [Paenibacillus polymyxa]|jgi:hypothetical protein|uniref:Uncharacterized protein n=1 Tax=Paenibacillus polymyxa TaxID=1406 RepID=A0A0F0G5Z3_PAEPO|nr:MULTISPECIES: hypothetical protein [Paenibacillus]AHM67017.1 hypothetical protein PPSQR21_033790 [Paenibacillus polymyxa SQR-21]AIY07818.1 hypothetical protein LK13_04090 [Paenibacillus polymyxa]AUS27601.1 hypothetical protein C1A50_3437 [Paenibacillus polymyxa]KAE8558528.1 hypothetical protein BJH92_19365 [Paenibacillus polymyxa]KAF6585785.1 hypothetical protein G9G57_03545 [Paenibacillus sp. EKM211P]